MPKITDMVRKRRAEAPNDPFFSFEYFPPKTEEGVYNLFSRMDRMSQKAAGRARPSAAACAKKGRIVGGVGCPPNVGEASGKPRGSSDFLELFRKMLIKFF